MGIVERIDGHIPRVPVLLARHTTDISGEIADLFANRFGGLGGLAPLRGNWRLFRQLAPLPRRKAEHRYRLFCYALLDFPHPWS